MPIKSVLTKPSTGSAIWCPEGIHAPLLGVATQARAFGRWKTVTLTEIGTSTIVTPPKNESIVLTDLIFTAEKKNAGIDTLRFFDGTNDENILIPSLHDSAVNLAIPFAGLWQGWKDAYLHLAQTGANHYVTVAVGYYFMPSELTETYARWNKLRDSR